ncbi:cytochrome P450, cyclodipeptide synthase-associated [Photorhabdus khanii]|uniref:Cytochrome P450, cyclodipeptide synthase-associated n=1 Tax=Photorhabdus khanii subsp. guanajuatensis TaxID=2100166 RepID=A0A4R4JIH4_9GAMM|nr:cytochrome P450, cyclodipeptide synthase-associated [Photorhabdus khanii]TDB52789.1 cytochrome P450, cyclodipeptide synthase-associated [Photorhabdus khanii subsp. guanajuatensis]
MAKLSSFNIHDPKFIKNPYDFYDTLHAQDLIYFDQSQNGYFIGKYEDVDTILKSSIFNTRPLFGRAEPVMGDQILALMEGEAHVRKRKLMMQGLSKDYFNNYYEPMIRKITENILQHYIEKGNIDLVNDFGRDYAVLVALGILGLPNDNYRDISEWHKGIADFITLFDQTEQEKKHSIECSQKLIRLLDPIVEQKRRNRNNSSVDFISIICGGNGQDTGMSTNEITALCLNILLAATEPTDKALGMMFYHLISNPSILDAVVKDRSLIRDVLEETLRLNSPVQLIPREAGENVTLSGVDIPKGSLIFCMIGAANRDPAIFHNPNTFDLYRRKNTASQQQERRKKHLALGTGMHSCIGAAFSLRQLEVSSNIILDRLHNLRFADNYNYQETGVYTRGPSKLLLNFDPIISSTAKEPLSFT